MDQTQLYLILRKMKTQDTENAILEAGKDRERSFLKRKDNGCQMEGAKTLIQPKCYSVIQDGY